MKIKLVVTAIESGRRVAETEWIKDKVEQRNIVSILDNIARQDFIDVNRTYLNKEAIGRCAFTILQSE